MLNIKFLASGKAASIHLIISILVALGMGVFVFSIWFPYPYQTMTRGYELFILIIAVEVICGPFLTFIIFNKKKTRKELALDLSLIVLIQISALLYGIWTLSAIRPLYLVHEFDRFKLISAMDVDKQELATLRENLRVGILDTPKFVSIRDVTKSEREQVLFESLQGGRDYGERPIFYTEYNGLEAYKKATSLNKFFKKNENLDSAFSDRKKINEKAEKLNVKENDIKYLPVVSRQDWIAIMNNQGKVIEYLKGDGF